jgi:outer membrane protein assembly factor BamE (lipoprotein component of BamABCDE complex)
VLVVASESPGVGCSPLYGNTTPCHTYIRKAIHVYTLYRSQCAAITTLTLVSACVSSGTSVTPEQLAQLQPGVTTETEIISKLGTPNQSSTLPDGTKMDMYMHLSSSVHAASFIPVVGMLAGGASHHVDSVTFTFNPQGVLKTVAQSNSQQDINTGLLNQK